MPLMPVKISVSFGFHPPRICYEMPFAWKLQNKEENNRYATCLAAAISSQAFVTFSVKLHLQTWTFLVANNSEKLVQTVQQKCLHFHGNTIGIRKFLAFRQLQCVPITFPAATSRWWFFGSSASGLCAPIAPSHALISMAAADTFVRLTSPSPQGVNKECSAKLS